MTGNCRRIVLVAALAVPALAAGLESARDAQNRAALQKLAAEYLAAAEKSPGDAPAQYQAALASSYLAEVDIELRDRAEAVKAAEAGVKPAERAVALQPRNSEYHRLLGTLYGQTLVGGNILTGLARGRRVKEEIDKAVELDPKSASNWVARAVGNYYLPAALGGGADKAIADAQKAAELDPKSAEAWLWLGLGLRKAHRDGEARQAFQKALELNPRRLWAKQQLEKTPAS